MSQNVAAHSARDMLHYATLEKFFGRNVARSRTEFGQKDVEMFVAGYVTLGKFSSSLCRNLCPVVARVPMKAD